MVEIGQGETITVSSVYDLRSESPVEIYVEDIWEGILCGVAAPVKSYPGE